MKKFLTIVIPTYNREKQLIRLLKSIERQNAIEKYYIVILNNHSNYNVELSVKSQFASSFYDNIDFYNRPYNAGGNYNIGSAFLFAKSAYLWIIGDDDEVCDGCFDIIEEDCIKYSDIPFFKYPSNMQKRSTTDMMISNINKFVEVNKAGLLTAGNIIFVSNNIFNLPQLDQYISTSLFYSYSGIPHSLPMLRCLMDERPFLLSNRDIVHYLEPDGDHWDYVKTVVSLSSVLNIDEDNKHYIVEKFFKVVMRHFDIVEFLQECVLLEDLNYRKHVCRIAMNTIFVENGSLDKFVYFLYKIETKFGVKLFSTYSSFVHYKETAIKKFKKQQIEKHSFIYRLYKRLKKLRIK